MLQFLVRPGLYSSDYAYLSGSSSDVRLHFWEIQLFPGQTKEDLELD